MRRRFVLQAAPAAVLAGLAAPAIWSRRACAAETLRIGDQKGGLKSLLEASGNLADSPNYSWSTFVAASPLIEALNAEAIDTGGVGDAPFAFARAAQARIWAVSALRGTGESTAIIVPKNSPCRSFTDLKGRKVATVRGSVGHLLVLAAAKKFGVVPKLVFLSPPDANVAMANGAVDAWSTWSQFLFLAMDKDGARELVNAGGLIGNLTYQVANKPAIEHKRALLVDLNRRIAAAQLWGLSHPDEYAASWSKETGVPLNVSRQSLLARGYRPVPLSQDIVADQQSLVDMCVSAGMMPAGQDVAAGFEMSFRAS
jgi:sulfonate transport system substrate-binding protein